MGTGEVLASRYGWDRGVYLGVYGNFWAERCGYKDRPGGRVLRPQVDIAAVKPRPSWSDV